MAGEAQAHPGGMRHPYHPDTLPLVGLQVRPERRAVIERDQSICRWWFKRPQRRSSFCCASMNSWKTTRHRLMATGP